MRQLVLSQKFKRAFRKFVKNNVSLQQKIEQILQRMEIDVFESSLGTHKLSGKLRGYHACSCGYDCRKLFCV